MPYRLSTSQTPTRLADYDMPLDAQAISGMFAPSCPDGYGICYCVMGEDQSELEHIISHVCIVCLVCAHYNTTVCHVYYMCAL